MRIDSKLNNNNLCFVFFFVYVHMISSRNNNSIFKFSIFSGEKVGELERSKFKIISSFQKRRDKQKKKLRNSGNFYEKSVFDTIDFGF